MQDDFTRAMYGQVGELIVRPHFVVASNQFRGHGLSALAETHPEDFLAAEDLSVIADPLGRLKELGYEIP